MKERVRRELVPSDFLPLSLVAVVSLVAASDGPTDIETIHKKIVDFSPDASGKISIAEVYGTTAHQVVHGLLSYNGYRNVAREESDQKRSFKITEFGKKVLEEEMKRLTSLSNLIKNAGHLASSKTTKRI